MGKNLPAKCLTDVVVADDELKDLVASFREDYDFEVRELVLMSLVADPTFEGRKGPAAYAERMNDMGIPITAGQITRILRKPKFMEACNRIIGDLIVDAGMWDVYKNMVQKAANPKDAHAVQAARLLFQATGKLKTNNEPIHTPETDPFARMVHAMKGGGGKLSVRERHVELQIADGPSQSRLEAPRDAEALPAGTGDDDTVDIENEPRAVEDDD